MMDAVCFSMLGGVFVSLMTGNILLLGLAIGKGHAIEDFYLFLVPLFFYALGTYSGGVISAKFSNPKTRNQFFCLVWLLILSASVLSTLLVEKRVDQVFLSLVAILSFASGLQSALLQGSGLKSFASNLMTSTLTSVLADFPNDAEKRKEPINGKLVSIVSFLLGAISGAVTTKFSLPIALSFLLIPLAIAIYGAIKEKIA